MDDGAEGIDRIAIEQDVDLDEVSGLLTRLVVIQRGVALRAGLELVEEVEDDLREG